MIGIQPSNYHTKKIHKYTFYEREINDSNLDKQL